MAHILIGTPCYNGWVATQYMVSMLGLQQELTRAGVGFSVEMPTTVSLIPVARNYIVARVLANPQLTHLLFIDADVGFLPSMVTRFLAFNKDIVAGAYPVKNLNMAVLRRTPPEQPLAAVFDYAVKLSEGEQSTADGFIKAEYAATGFMLIRREVLERMAAHYPELKYGDSFTLMAGSKPPPDQHLIALFDSSLDPETNQYLPEDYTFCKRWRKMGGEIWVDVFSRLNHVGTYTFEGDFATKFRK